MRLTPARADDRSPWQRLGPWVRGKLLLMDLGYFAYELFARIADNGGFFLSRLKGNANPLIWSFAMRGAPRTTDVLSWHRMKTG